MYFLIDIQLPTSTINKLNRISLKISDSYEGTLGKMDARFVILVVYVAPKLYNLIRAGYTSKESLNWLEDNGISFTKSMSEKYRTYIMTEKVCKSIWGETYSKCYEDFFLKPLVDDLISQGIDFIIGKGAERIDPLDIKNLLVRESNEKLKIGKGTQELGLMERLALAGVKGYSEIADALGTLGLLDFGGDKSHVIRRYVMSRWGKKYRSFNKFIAFLKTSFLRGEDN